MAFFKVFVIFSNEALYTIMSFANGATIQRDSWQICSKVANN